MNRKATAAAGKRKQASSRVPVTVRLPETVIKQIDRDLTHRDIPLSRNTWLHEAVLEKLKRNGQGGINGSE